MDTAILPAVIGLAGALIGAVIGGWVTHLAAKRQVEALKEATDRQIREHAVQSDKALRHSLQVAKASSFMERFSSPAYMEIRDEVELFLTEIRSLTGEGKLAAFLSICQRDTADRVRKFNRLHALGMFFGEVGVSFESDHLDCDGLAIFDRILPYYWHEMSYFISACHIAYGFHLDAEKPLVEQNLIFFGKFCSAYKEMVENGLAKEPPGLSVQHSSRPLLDAATTPIDNLAFVSTDVAEFVAK